MFLLQTDTKRIQKQAAIITLCVSVFMHLPFIYTLISLTHSLTHSPTHSLTHYMDVVVGNIFSKSYVNNISQERLGLAKCKEKMKRDKYNNNRTLYLWLLKSWEQFGNHSSLFHNNYQINYQIG